MRTAHMLMAGLATALAGIGSAAAASPPVPPAVVEHGASTVTMDPVKVRAPHWRDIRGATDQCVDARFLRGWREDGEGLVVEVSPRRHAGNRYYRVETVGSCPDLGGAHAIQLASRNRGAAVCGRPGDKVVLLDHVSQGLAAMGTLPTGAFSRGCEISRVVPMPRH
ncbi:hypothetical protein H4F99_14075 [Lysobacter sp. SG-8]|uniref:Uncharacterized protein n=1 Tax=Marilutibacter penaei TaxID=2759900 RepID=A0A7W3U653_9GAMM|nr:hypothetical protein [Lysobacter penaei]MBB1089608.1 hypothetical protein [Lysobacter penaei]